MILRIATYLLVTAFFIGSITPTFSQSPEQLFQKGLVKEEGEGALNEAIDIYNKIVDNQDADKALQAKALLHVGQCYEKLGRNEATKAYQSLVNNFPGQKNEVAIAKERLTRLMPIVEKVSKTLVTPKFTKIKIPTELSWSVVLSPDGENLALVSDKKLWKMPLSGNLGQGIPGAPIQLNTENIEVEWTGLSWSRDGKWIAFNDYPKTDEKGDIVNNQRIYIVPSGGGTPQKIIENNRDVKTVNYRISLSPDGTKLAYSFVEDNKQYIQTISVKGGEPKLLTPTEAREPVFSPDGKMIAFVEDKDIGKYEGDQGLWIIPAEGGTSHLIAEAGKASSPVWSPDGKMIAFLDYTLKKKINIVPVSKDGVAAGKVTTINVPKGIENANLLAGWTPDNKIGALLRTEQEYALYTLPSTGGQAAIILNDCFALQPRWSPDGKQIFYTTEPLEGNNKSYRMTFASVSSKGGSGKFIPQASGGKNLKPFGTQAGNRISPDGNTIISAAWCTDDTLANINWPGSHIWKISADGLEQTKLTEIDGPYVDLSPSWSPDGKTIAFKRIKLNEEPMQMFGEASIFTVSSSGGVPKLLLTESDKWIISPVWSPDGNMIAYLTQEKDASETKSMNIININSGESRIIGEVPTVHFGIELAWSPDSKRIAFNDKEGKVIKIMSLFDGSIEDIKTNLVDVTIYHLDWSPDGERFVFGGFKGGNREFWFLENFLPLDKLAQKKEANITPPQLTNKKIWNESDTDLEGVPSPNGKNLSYVDWETGDLAIYEIATGKKRRLTNKGSWDESKEFALMSRWSPDSKQIVYDWKNGNDFCDLRIIGLDGSKPRILYSNKDVKWTYTYDWSPDGNQILAYFDRKKGTDMIGQIVLVSTVDGSERVLKTTPITEAGATGPDNLCFSTDGRYIVYDFPQKEGSLERDIFMLSSDGNLEIPLVEHPAHDELFGWAPDGKNILFASDRNGTFSLWSKQIVEGKPHGNAKLVKSDMGSIKPLGFTREGLFYYGYSQKNNNMYNAEFDPETGEILAQPKRTITRFEGYNQTPIYSPDGKYLAYISRRFPLTVFPDYSMAKIGGNVLCIKSLETGKERDILPNLKKFRSPHWSPNGLSVFVIEMNNSGSNQIDIQTGNVMPVLFDDNLGPQPTERSHDGKTIFYVHHDKKAKIYQILVRDLESGTKKEIYRSDGGLHIRLSPDGQWLAIQAYYMENFQGLDKIPSLSIIPTAGGEPLELCRFEEGIDIKAGAPFTWTPDGKYILYTMKSKKKDVEKWDLYRISAKGGNPEKLGLEMGGFLMNLSVHPDGRQIAFSITEESNAEIWVMENFLPNEETDNKHK